MNDQLPIILLGCGGHARSCIDIIENDGRFRIAGLIGLEYEVGNEILGYKVLASEVDLDKMKKIAKHALVTIGQIKTPEIRVRLFNSIIFGGWSTPSIISPKAVVSRHAIIGDGTIVMAGAIVNAGARVGSNCIVNSRALIEHDCNIGDHCHISTGAIINGEVIIGSSSFVGSGALVHQGLVIGKGCVIGMGQMILKNCPDQSRIPAW